MTSTFKAQAYGGLRTLTSALAVCCRNPPDPALFFCLLLTITVPLRQKEAFIDMLIPCGPLLKWP